MRLTHHLRNAGESVKRSSKSTVHMVVLASSLTPTTSKKEELDEVIAHELGHILLDDIDDLLSQLLGAKLREYVVKTIERTNERFARAFSRARNHRPKGK
jgi:hypothetical protein